jgi:membrane-bound inhibitor of C-type lysozyme
MHSKTYKIILAIIVVIIVILGIWWGISISKNATPSASNTKTTVTYVCPSGSNVEATFNNADHTVTLTDANGQQNLLPQTRSADGGRYANSDESYIFWDKGNEALVTQNAGKAQTCIKQSAVTKINANKANITQTVTSFGNNLQNVSLLGPKASSSMAKQYGPYVTANLLSDWQKNPSSAPGRKASNPYPDHITISNIEPGGVVYSVNGQIVFMDSHSATGAGNTATKNFTMTMSKRNNKWLIASFMFLNNSTSTATSTHTPNTSK